MLIPDDGAVLLVRDEMIVNFQPVRKPVLKTLKLTIPNGKSRGGRRRRSYLDSVKIQ
jgi:hypothetical protein